MVSVSQAILEAKADIDKAIRSAEQGTTGEIVVVAAQRAGDYGRQEALIAFIAALLSIGLAWPVLQALWQACAVLILGYLAGLAIAKAFPSLPLIFTSRRHVLPGVQAAAALAFRDLNVCDTQASTGVLIFIAELERTVLVQGDKAIAKKVGHQEWEGVRDSILEGIRAKKPAQGVIDGVGRAGDLLKKHFPSSGDDTDELPNRIHLA